LNTVTPAARGTLFVGVWRGTKDEEFVADADDSGHPGRAWVTFVKGQHQSEATSFREAVIADLKKRFPDALALPVLPSGGLPLSDDLRLTSAGYKIARRAAADYGLPPSSPLLADFWRQLGNHLGIEVVSPFVFESDQGLVEFTALLPQFGAPRGMVVDGDWEVMGPHADALSDAGYGFSCCEGGEYDDNDPPLDMLRDWGWSGTAPKPDWL
jgi:hypothetical protein